ncbi:sulfatase-like hydrolase/transferase [Pedobacter sp. HDW13]|uniref:sulfatase-like hydrolase/transferase n=1 Tax=Pedobacter sp. HDW13 TaxID=2714940 RepID=UPI00140E3DCB|nr:sulfatase-like hydrolase/transferase [Pedobacter sp. HDW13]QIL39403.1 sulfatase-like hydrolase/transferase [Pedobacter sp. HDW13]
MKSSKRNILRYTLLILWCTISVSAVNAQQKPNIIYVLVDDLGYGDLGVLFQNQKDKNLPALVTPNLDAMARAGAVLSQQYANAPVCAPSRASLLTGVNQGNAHIRDNQFDKALENNHTMATVLKDAGYATVAIGKWGLQGTDEKQRPNWPAHPLKRGFDQYYGYMRHADGHEHYPVEGVYRGKKEVWNNYTEVSADLQKCYTTDLWTAKAKDYIIGFEKQHQAKQPFFMYLAYDAPHAVLELPTQSYPKGGGLNGGLQWLNQKGNMINSASGTVDSYTHPDYANATYDDDRDPGTPNKPWPDTYKRYATAVRRLDDAIGDIRALLSDLKIADNTIIVFTSDNGPSIESYLPKQYVPNHPTFFESYGPFDGIKRDCWEGGLRMPSVIAWPKRIPAGKVVNIPSMLSDWLPTFADAAGAPIPARVTGVSLVPSLTNAGKQIAGNVYVEYFESGSTPAFSQFEANHASRKRNQMQMVRIGDLVGVRYNIKSAADDFEIYNVVKDPKQTNNLAKNTDLSGLQNQFRNRALQLRMMDQEAKRPYDSIAIPGVQMPKSTKPGLKWSFFPGNFHYVSVSNQSKPAASGVVQSLATVTAKNKGMIQYQTLFKIDKKGTYTFRLSTAGKAFVKLHQINLLDADFGYTSGKEIEKTVSLEAGYHPLSIYALKGTNNSLKLEFKGEDGVWHSLSGENAVY